jgi:hypothetical protein
MSIAVRAIASLIQSQGIGDLYRIYLTCQRDGVGYNLAYIAASFHAPHREAFDTGAKGYRWAKTPPGY